MKDKAVEGEMYLTGTYALNLPSVDGTPGDWHHSAIDWTLVQSMLVPVSSSLFGHLGLYEARVPGGRRVLAADNVRACLDLIAGGYFGSAQGMRDCFLDDPSTTPVVFEAVWGKLRGSEGWDEIDRFMGREYGCAWLDFLEGKDE